MRINFAPLRPAILYVLDINQIRYALLACLSFTDQTKKLAEMLLYVLLCSNEIAKKLDAQDRIFDIIDKMSEVIGSDYKDYTAYPSACIFAKLDRQTHQILFAHITAPGGTEEQTNLTFAKSKLTDLLTQFDNNRLAFINKADTFLVALNKYLQHRLNEIVIQIARNIY